MKRILFLVVLMAIALLSAGCTFEFATPDSLITPPLSNQEAVQQRQQISDCLEPGEVLITPTGMTGAQAYMLQDLDDDGEDEIVAFYTNKESNFILGFLILDQKEATWKQVHKVVAYGTEVDYFQISDLDGDGHKDILFGVKTGFGSTKELYIYSIVGEELKEVTQDEQLSYDSVLLSENTEGNPLLVTAQVDTTQLVGNSMIRIYQLSSGDIFTVFEQSFDGYCSELRYGSINKTTQGIYAAMRHNHFTNILLLTESADGFVFQLEKPLPFDYQDLQQLEIFGDINKDGTLEVCSLWVPEENNTTKSYHEYIQVWLRWNGYGDLEPVQAMLSGRTEGYEFTIPLSWLDQLYYGFRSEGNISWVDFYHQDEQMDLKVAFSIAAVDQLTWEQDQNKDRYVVLGNNPNKNKVYIAEILQEQFGPFKIDASQLISYLKIDGGK